MRPLIAVLLLSAAPIKVVALDMFHAYAKNEIAGDLKYKDKLLEVSGPVFAVGKAVDGSYFVTIGHGGIWVAQCQLSTTPDPKAADLETGQRIAVTGTCGGLKRIGKYNVVFLSDCAVTSAEAPCSGKERLPTVGADFARVRLCSSLTFTQRASVEPGELYYNTSGDDLGVGQVRVRNGKITEVVDPR